MPEAAGPGRAPGNAPARPLRRALVLGGTLAAAALFFGFPDLDIRLLGIALHRYFLFHSALPAALLFVLAARRGGKPGWTAARTAAAGCGLGIGAHLAADVFQAKSVVFPFVGTLVRGSSLDDRLWLAANAAVSLALGAVSLARARP